MEPPPTPSKPETNPTDIPIIIKDIISSINNILTPFHDINQVFIIL
ncbi:MAG: hypothetical protein LBR15_04345 [Methanobrevibacter sp.]|jgi:hypothetical protein|nr:hypothetical protein [Candidatus Methanovirga australis]